MPSPDEQILVLDFGSQYGQLIARRVREQNVYCRIVSHRTPAGKIREMKPKGLVLSGGQASVYAPGAPTCDPEIFHLGIPILGICYGMQLGARILGGEVKGARLREFGRTEIEVRGPCPLFEEMPERLTVWMSHGDYVAELPPGFEVLASSPNCPFAAVGTPDRKFFGLQFHPEVVHTPRGREIFHNFLYKVCGCSGAWAMGPFAEETIRAIRERVGEDRVICGLSGGVDSSVVAVLLHRAIGPQLTCVFVDNGLLRLDERDHVEEVFQEHFKIPLVVVDASDAFLDGLRGVIDPEAKRKIIGRIFIDVFSEEARKVRGAKFLAQGTLYPDVIESISAQHDAPSATIKTHHNVGGLPPDLKFELIEPLKDLFKDEVRQIGRKLGLPEAILRRHPFPGPGLAVRVLGEVTRPRLEILRRADAIVEEEIQKSGFYEKVWQAFAVLLPVQTVGVMGDERTYENVVAVRCVESEDAMTADWTRLPYDLLATLSNRIINEVRGVNRVVYDVSSKPPATIEWE